MLVSGMVRGTPWGTPWGMASFGPKITGISSPRLESIEMWVNRPFLSACSSDEKHHWRKNCLSFMEQWPKNIWWFSLYWNLRSPKKKLWKIMMMYCVLDSYQAISILESHCFVLNTTDGFLFAIYIPSISIQKVRPGLVVMAWSLIMWLGFCEDSSFGQNKSEIPWDRTGSIIITLVHDKISPKNWQVASPLVMQGFSNLLRVVSKWLWQTRWSKDLHRPYDILHLGNINCLDPPGGDFQG